MTKKIQKNKQDNFFNVPFIYEVEKNFYILVFKMFHK